MIDLSNIPGSEPDEQTVFFLRRHWFKMIPVLVCFLLALALPFAAYAAVKMRIPDFFESPGALPLYVLGASIFFLYAWLFLFQSFIDWYLDIWIVTNYRIINIEQIGLFGRTTSELMLYNVQDVTSDIKGFIRTILDFGTIHIQTAGETKRFEFEDIEHPNHVAKRVLELAHVRRIEHQRKGNEPVGAEL
jgi:uncharacterized membrane protein YdbT with pleckstrin-like domain